MTLPEGSHIIRQVTVGSTAYGLANADSDVDTLGVYIVPLRLAIGLDAPKFTDASHVSNNPDVTLHEVGKFFRLALKCNPTILELFFADAEAGADGYLDRLLQQGVKGINTKGVRDAYGGYARQQAHRLLNRSRAGQAGFDPDLAKRTAKHGRHCFRLMIQAEELLTTGHITLDVSAHRDEIYSMGELAERDPQGFYDAFEARDEHLRSIPSILPNEPDRNAVNNALVLMRQWYK